MNTIAQELAALRELDTTQLVVRYETAFGRPPRSRNREALFRRLAYDLQERRLGGLPKAARAKLEGLVAEIGLPTTTPSATRSGLAVGTVLTRVWRGRTLHLAVRDDGFEVDGVLYGSLSAAATGVTGTKWNGRAFWGVER